MGIFDPQPAPQNWAQQMAGWNWQQPAPAAAAVMPQVPMAMPTSADLNWAQPQMSASRPFVIDGMDTSSAPGFDNGVPATEGGGFKDWISNGQNLSAVMQGLGALTSAWLGFQQLRVAKDQLGFQKSAWAKNYGNQVKSYNTSLEDRIRGRTADYTGKEQDVQSYLDKHRLGG